MHDFSKIGWICLAKSTFASPNAGNANKTIAVDSRENFIKPFVAPLHNPRIKFPPGARFQIHFASLPLRDFALKAFAMSFTINRRRFLQTASASLAFSALGSYGVELINQKPKR